MKKIIWCFVAALIVAFCGCIRKPSPEEDDGGSVKPTVAVKATKLHRGDMPTVVSAVGKVDAIVKQKLFSPVAGKMISVKVLEGASIQAGDIIAVVQTRESQAAITGAQALLRGARTPQQKEEAQTALNLAKASENSVQIRATFSGIVATRSISEGEFVAENAELFTVIDQSTLVFIADVPTRDLQAIRLGQHAIIRIQSTSRMDYAGEIEAVYPQADVLNQTSKVRLRLVHLSNSARQFLKADMVGTASILVGLQKGVFIVPQVAVLRNDEANSFTVVTFGPDSVAHSLPVEVTGMTDSTRAIAGPGLKEGMNIVTEGHYALPDSTRITVAQ